MQIHNLQFMANQYLKRKNENFFLKIALTRRS